MACPPRALPRRQIEELSLVGNPHARGILRSLRGQVVARVSIDFAPGLYCDVADMTLETPVTLFYLFCPCPTAKPALKKDPV